MTVSTLDAQIQAFESRAKGIESAYFKRIGEHIKRIGNMLPSDVNNLIEMRRLDTNMDEIKGELVRYSGKTYAEIDSLFLSLAVNSYAHAAQLMGIKSPPSAYQNEELMQLVQAQARVTKGKMFNLSNTTIRSDLYRRAVDTAVQAVQMGTTDYGSAIRMAATRLAQTGMVVVYPTGVTRRLDSAVRQNVLDGTRALNQAVMDIVGEAFGADGVEITAHAMCAEDHLPYQGRQYSATQFEELQQDLLSGKKGKGRPFGIWNCRHIARPIILGISKPAYSPEQLEEYKQKSTRKTTIGGKTLTAYEWTQEQRKIETEIRRQRDIVQLASSMGSAGDGMARSAKAAIKSLEDRYVFISKSAGIETQFNRTLPRTR